MRTTRPTAPASEPAPHYRRIKEHLLAAIARGTWRPGDRVPSEGELTRQFAVSRMTVNRALRELAAEGHIDRMQGRGSFVAEPKAEVTMLVIRSIADDVRRRGSAYDCTVLKLQRVLDDKIGARLGLGPGVAHFRSLLLHRADGVAIQVEDRRVNPDFAPDYLEQDFLAITPHDHLMSLDSLDFVEHAIEAERPRPAEARLLGMPPEEPCLVLHRRTWSRGMVASIVRFLAPARRSRFTGATGVAPPGLPDLPPL